jgi:hypothetical protein
VLFALRNPKLATRDRRRVALVAATLGQSLLARRGRAVAAEKKPLLDDLRRILLAYLQPVLEPPVVETTAGGMPEPPATAKKR